MTTKTYGEKLKDPRWQKVRLQVMDRDKFSCRLCGDKETTLNVHHLQYNGDPWECPFDKLITLCEDCHEIITIEKIDLNLTSVDIRKIKRETHHTILGFVEDGMWLYKKLPNKKVIQLTGISHDVLRYMVHDVINYWLKTDRDHYLTEKLTVNA